MPTRTNPNQTPLDPSPADRFLMSMQYIWECKWGEEFHKVVPFPWTEDTETPILIAISNVADVFNFTWRHKEGKIPIRNTNV